MPGADLLAAGADDQLVAVGLERVDAAAGAGALAELAAERLRQPAGPAEQVAGDQRALAAPDEREQADAAAGRQLVELRGGAVGRAGEDLLRPPAAAGRGTRANVRSSSKA